VKENTFLEKRKKGKKKRKTTTARLIFDFDEKNQKT
jgi:hypothetical protein